MTRAEDPQGKSGQYTPFRKGDALAYLCDIILELKHLADQSGQRTLSAILAAALTEARIQSEAKRR